MQYLVNYFLKKILQYCTVGPSEHQTTRVPKLRQCKNSRKNQKCSFFKYRISKSVQKWSKTGPLFCLQYVATKAETLAIVVFRVTLLKKCEFRIATKKLIPKGKHLKIPCNIAIRHLKHETSSNIKGRSFMVQTHRKCSAFCFAARDGTPLEL